MGRGDFLSPAHTWKDFDHTHASCVAPAFDAYDFGVPSALSQVSG